jgi:hypothetical protein
MTDASGSNRKVWGTARLFVSPLQREPNLRNSTLARLLATGSIPKPMGHEIRQKTTLPGIFLWGAVLTQVTPESILNRVRATGNRRRRRKRSFRGCSDTPNSQHISGRSLMPGPKVLASPAREPVSHSQSHGSHLPCRNFKVPLLRNCIHHEPVSCRRNWRCVVCSLYGVPERTVCRPS